MYEDLFSKAFLYDVDESTSHTLYIARMCHDRTYSIKNYQFSVLLQDIFHSYAKLMQLHLFLMTNLERELPDLWLAAISTPTLDSEVRPFLREWTDNKFLLLYLWLYCLRRIWNYQSEIDWQYHFRVESTDQDSKVFFFEQEIQPFEV